MSLASRSFGRCLRWLPLLSLASVPAAHAHHLPPGFEEVDEFATHGVASSLIHPLTGADHLLVALGVGWIAWSLGRTWIKPLLAGFISALFMGVIVGKMTGGFAALESGVVLSVAVVGVLLMSGKLLSRKVTAAMLLCIAMLHGMAHGTESPASMSVALWALGLCASTAMLCVGGVLMAELSSRRLPRAQSWASVALVLAGAFLWFNA